MNRFLSLILLLIIPASLIAQTGIQGTVKNQKGEMLPFAAVAVRGTEQGTMANEDGQYRLDLKPGYYEIVFQYLGYQSGMKAITITSETVTFDAVLAEQALDLAELKIGARNEDPAYTIMRRAIAKSRYHSLQVESYKAKAYTKSSVVITDLPFEFLYKKELEKIAKEENFKKGVPILNETISEIEFQQPNIYKQKVLASRNSQDNNFANPNEYLLSSFYKPDVVGNVSPLSPKAFSYYKFEYLGSFREHGIEVNKIKVIPRAYGDGVFRGTIHIIENLWCIHSLDLETVKTGIGLKIKQLYAPVQQVWVPVNQQFHADGGIYGIKGKADYVISQSFSSLKVNPVFAQDIEVLDEKKEKEEVKPVRLSNRDIKNQNLEELMNGQKKFSARNLRKIMKEYDKQTFEATREKGEDVDMIEKRVQSTEIDSMATRRGIAYWDSIRTVPLSTAESVSYKRLDSLVKVRKPEVKTKEESDTDQAGVQVRKGKKFPLTNVLTGHTFNLSKEPVWKLKYTGLVKGLQVNTVEGWTIDRAGFSLMHTAKADTLKHKKGYSLALNALARYSFARNKVAPLGELEYKWTGNRLSVSGGRAIAQFNPENPIAPVLNSVTTLFFERNFAKIYQKDFVRFQYDHQQQNDHFKVNVFVEYADRQNLVNLEKTNPYRWINWRKREFTSNTPDNEHFSYTTYEPDHLALTAGVSASWKPWQQYRIRKGKLTYYKDDSPEFSFTYRKGFPEWAGSKADYDFLKLKVSHGLETGIKSKLYYQVAAGSFLNNTSVHFADFHHFAGNRFFFQLGDPVGTFRMLDYYRLSTDQRFAEVHILSEFRQLVFTQLTWFRKYGIKETLQVHYLATPSSRNYTELGYGFDVGIRFPFRVEVVGSFENMKHRHTTFRIGTTMNLPF